MIPIGKLRSRTMSAKQRRWLKKQLYVLGWFETERRDTGWRHTRSNHHVIWRRRSDEANRSWWPFSSVLNAAKAAGIRYVPAI